MLDSNSQRPNLSVGDISGINMSAPNVGAKMETTETLHRDISEKSVTNIDKVSELYFQLQFEFSVKYFYFMGRERPLYILASYEHCYNNELKFY